MLVYSNELIMVGTPLNILIMVVTGLIAVIALSSGLEGYVLIAQSRVTWMERIVLFAVVVLCAIPGHPLTLAGLGIYAAILVFRKFKKMTPKAISA